METRVSPNVRSGHVLMSGKIFYWEGRDIDTLTKDELKQALIELGQLYEQSLNRNLNILKDLSDSMKPILVKPKKRSTMTILRKVRKIL